MELTHEDIMPLVAHYHQKLQSVSMSFTRYLYNRINWDSRLICIKGARGIGKTTLLVQRIRRAHPDPDKALYVSLDDLWFTTHRLEDLVTYMYSRGVCAFYFDEVHKYPEWSRAIKNFYDFYPDIKIVYTGSALLAIDHSVADLSRRQSVYTMWGMSFREYLEYEGVLTLEPLSLEQLLKDHVAVSMDISSRIRVLGHFEDYLRRGCYPFYKEAGAEFQSRLAEVIRLVIEVDVPQAEDVSFATVSKMRKLMMVIAENAPLEPNISKLAERLECSRELCLKMLYLLEKATLIKLLFRRQRTYKQMCGPEKVLGGDTSLLSCLTGTANIGTIRETFFVNQTGNIGEITLAEQGDYRIDDRFVFEVGGQGKKFTQIADIPDSYLAVDGIETGYGSRIPLYMFGLLY